MTQKTTKQRWQAGHLDLQPVRWRKDGGVTVEALGSDGQWRQVNWAKIFNAAALPLTAFRHLCQVWLAHHNRKIAHWEQVGQLAAVVSRATTARLVKAVRNGSRSGQTRT